MRTFLLGLRALGLSAIAAQADDLNGSRGNVKTPTGSQQQEQDQLNQAVRPCHD